MICSPVDRSFEPMMFERDEARPRSTAETSGWRALNYCEWRQEWENAVLLKHVPACYMPHPLSQEPERVYVVQSVSWYGNRTVSGLDPFCGHSWVMDANVLSPGEQRIRGMESRISSLQHVAIEEDDAPLSSAVVGEAIEILRGAYYAYDDPWQFPKGSIYSTDDGGIRFEWSGPRGDVRVVLPGNVDRRKYIYYGAPGCEPEVLKVDGQTLANYLSKIV